MPASQLFERGRTAHVHFCQAASSLIPPFLLLVRLYWGWQFSQTGWGKLHRLPQVTHFFASLNIPAPGVNAVFVSWLELIGGFALDRSSARDRYVCRVFDLRYYGSALRPLRPGKVL
jgi:hypothetical protein